EHPSPDVLDKLRAGTKTRREPLVICLSNAGYSRDSVAWRMRDYTMRVLTGMERNDTWFGLIYALDACESCYEAGHHQPTAECARCDQISDEAVWPKANPLLELALPRQYLREQVAEALAMPSKRSIVERLNFGIWSTSIARWLSADTWTACGGSGPTDAEL